MSETTAALTVVPDSVILRTASPAAVTVLIRRRVEESIALKECLLDDGLVDTVARLADHTVQSLRAGGKVMIFGNGGSAADATHLAAEFVGRFAFDRAPMPALSLSDNGSSITAIGNDYDYGQTFARQVQAFGAPGDVAIALSTSGSSANVLNAMRTAREQHMLVAAFTGSKGGGMADAADLAVMIPSLATARIQEGYMLYAHILCELVEQEMFGQPAVLRGE